MITKTVTATTATVGQIDEIRIVIRSRLTLSQSSCAAASSFIEKDCPFDLHKYKCFVAPKRGDALNHCTNSKD